MEKAKVDQKICRGCGCCLRSCALKALSYKGLKPEVNENCVGCGICVKACPFDAITLVAEE